MQQDFYTVEHLATQLLSSAFVNLNNIPDYRLRPMLHILSKFLAIPEDGLQKQFIGTRGGRAELHGIDGIIYLSL